MNLETPKRFVRIVAILIQLQSKKMVKAHELIGSFVAAEKMMQHFINKNLGDHFEKAILKIKSILRGTEKDWVAALNTMVFSAKVRIPPLCLNRNSATKGL